MSEQLSPLPPTASMEERLKWAESRAVQLEDRIKDQNLQQMEWSRNTYRWRYRVCLLVIAILFAFLFALARLR